MLAGWSSGGDAWEDSRQEWQIGNCRAFRAGTGHIGHFIKVPNIYMRKLRPWAAEALAQALEPGLLTPKPNSFSNSVSGSRIFINRNNDIFKVLSQVFTGIT